MGNNNNNNNTVHKNAQELAFQLQEKILGTPLDIHCIKRMKKFQGITERVTFKGSRQPNFVHRGTKHQTNEKVMKEQRAAAARHNTNKKHSKKPTNHRHRRLFQNDNNDIVVDTGGDHDHDHDHDNHSIRREEKIQKSVPKKHHIRRHGHGQQNRHIGAEEKKQLQEKVYKTTTHDQYLDSLQDHPHKSAAQVPHDHQHVQGRKKISPNARNRIRNRIRYQKPGAYDAYTEQQKSLSKYTKEDLQFILDQVDLEFESSIGYDYDYIYDMIEKDDFEGHDGWNDNISSGSGSGSGSSDGGKADGGW